MEHRFGEIREILIIGIRCDDYWEHRFVEIREILIIGIRCDDYWETDLRNQRNFNKKGRDMAIIGNTDLRN